VTARLRGDTIDDITFSGDFTLLPALGLERLERELPELKADRELLVARLETVYGAAGIQSPGVSPADFAEAILLATDGLVNKEQ
jgi:hypothetical protein